MCFAYQLELQWPIHCSCHGLWHPLLEVARVLIISYALSFWKLDDQKSHCTMSEMESGPEPSNVKGLQESLFSAWQLSNGPLRLLQEPEDVP